MSYQFRPAVRENTPLIIGIGGPTKSGKTYSALRLALGLAKGKPVAMINAEGPRGHQYAETFKYVACDIEPPYRPSRYTEALGGAAALAPGAVIIDSASHMHDGPGGVLEWHEEILDRMAAGDDKKRQRSTFAAWVEPKAAENQFIYTMLGMTCPVILCFRAKEKIKLVTGKEPIDLGWQPIAGERVAFETIFTVMLPPYSKGVPDLSISWMREPFDAMVPADRPIDEQLGQRLAMWARGGTSSAASRTRAAPGAAVPAPPVADTTLAADGDIFSDPASQSYREAVLTAIEAEFDAWKPRPPLPESRRSIFAHFGAENRHAVDIAVLDEILTLAHKVREGDGAARARAVQIVKAAQQKATVRA